MHIIAESLIEFSANKPENIPDSDWIFFTSKNSVRFFFKQGFTVGARKTACVGSGTYKELAKHVTNIQFIGDSVDVKKVGEAFVNEVNGGSCLFPVSNISKRTIQQYFLDQSKVTDLIVYDTKEKIDFINPQADTLIFTSPSNARAYFSKHQLEKQNVIAIGPSTGNQLKDLGIHNFKTPKSTGEIGLIDLI